MVVIIRVPCYISKFQRWSFRTTRKESRNVHKRPVSSSNVHQSPETSVKSTNHFPHISPKTFFSKYCLIIYYLDLDALLPAPDSHRREHFAAHCRPPSVLSSHSRRADHGPRSGCGPPCDRWKECHINNTQIRRYCAIAQKTIHVTGGRNVI